MRSALAILVDLSCHLQRRIDDLNSVNHRSEQILRYLAFCHIENDADENDEMDEETPLNRAECAIESGATFKSLSVSREDEESVVTITSNTLEDVLNLAREIRERRVAGKGSSQKTLKEINSKRISDSKLCSKIKATSTVTKCMVGGPLKDLKNGVLVPPIVPRNNSNSKQREVIQNEQSSVMNNSNTINENRAMPIREHLFSQLDMLRRQNKKQAPMYDTNKDLYASQQHLLSCINGQVTFPRSIAYHALKNVEIRAVGNVSHIKNINGNSSLNSNSNSSYHDQNMNDSHEILFDSLRRNQERYNKILRSRLNRIPISKMSKDDLKEVFSAWYQTQKLLEAVEHANPPGGNQENVLSSEKVLSSASRQNVLLTSGASGSIHHISKTEVEISHENERKENGKKIIQDLKKLQQLKMNVISTIPISSSHYINSSNDNIISSREWLVNSSKNTHKFHENFDSKVKYLIETGIGRYDLRSTVKKLKECCAMQSELRNCRHEVDLDQKWIDALKHYKAVHTCLVSEARNDISCTFVPRNSV